MSTVAAGWSLTYRTESYPRFRTATIISVNEVEMVVREYGGRLQHIGWEEFGRMMRRGHIRSINRPHAQSCPRCGGSGIDSHDYHGEKPCPLPA